MEYEVLKVKWLVLEVLSSIFKINMPHEEDDMDRKRQKQQRGAFCYSSPALKHFCGSVMGLLKFPIQKFDKVFLQSSKSRVKGLLKMYQHHLQNDTLSVMKKMSFRISFLGYF